MVAAGVFGSQNPTRNLAPIWVWVIWWVGFAYVSALVGDLWSVVNPWATMFTAASTILQRLGLRLRPHPYPVSLGVWPAAVLFAAFVWLELVYDSRAIPMRLGM